MTLKKREKKKILNMNFRKKEREILKVNIRKQNVRIEDKCDPLKLTLKQIIPR